MKEVVVISGKGGTGKTSVTASFAMLEKNAVFADCDVDAANMRILLEEKIIESEDFYSGEMAIIDQSKCIKCGKCFNVCRFDGIIKKNWNFLVNELNCEGCGYCAQVCPRDAIKMETQNIGEIFISKTINDSILIHAELIPGAENSGKLVAEVKRKARIILEQNHKDFLIVDGSPGIGCPVISSLSGANYVVLVTEPTVSGIHDLKRVLELVKKFQIKAGCVINKFDLNKQQNDELVEFLKDENIPILGNIPYDERIIHSLNEKKTLVNAEIVGLTQIITEIWNKIKENI